MPPHIDEYRIMHSSNGLSHIRRVEGDELKKYLQDLKARGLTIANANFLRSYVLTTPVHNDGECHIQPGVKGSEIITSAPAPTSTQELKQTSLY